MRICRNLETLGFLTPLHSKISMSSSNVRRGGRICDEVYSIKLMQDMLVIRVPAKKIQTSREKNRPSETGNLVQRQAIDQERNRAYIFREGCSVALAELLSTVHVSIHQLPGLVVQHRFSKLRKTNFGLIQWKYYKNSSGTVHCAL